MEGQNHIGSENSYHTSDGSSSEASSKKSLSSHSSSPSKHPSSDGIVKNHHSKPREHSSPSGNSVKHKDGAYRPKDPHLKHSSKPKDHKHRVHSSSKSKDHHKDSSAKPRDPNTKPTDHNHKVSSHPKDPSLKHKDPSQRHKDPSVKQKDPNAKPRDPNAKPRDPNAKPRDPNAKPRDPNAKPRDPNAKPRDPNAKPRDPNTKPRDPNAKPRDPNAKPRDPSVNPKDPSQIPKDPSLKSKNSSSKHKDPNAKQRDPSLKSKDPSAKPKDPNMKPKSSSEKQQNKKTELSSPKPSDPNRPKDPNKKLKEGYVRMKDGTIRKKSSSSKDPNRHSSSGSSKPSEKSHSGDVKHIKKENVSDGTKGDSSREGNSVKHPDRVIKKEGDGSTMVKQERPSSPVKVKKENGAVTSPSPIKTVKPEPESDDEDEKPLNQRLQEKRPLDDSEDDEPLTNRIEKVKKKRKSESDEEFVPEKAKKRKKEPDDEDFDEKPLKKKKKKDDAKKKKKDKKDVKGKNEKTATKKKKKEEEAEVWKWWEEEPLPEGVRWRFLEHKGPVFAPPYEPLPPKVKFYYDGKHIVLSEEAEEVAGFYARMLDHDYTTKEIFNKNFFRDWRKSMNKEEQAIITDLQKCDFTRMHKYFLEQAELRKNRTKEEKQALKEANEKVMQEYGFCNIDGHKEKIGNFKIEPPGLFRGRGDHPKMGMLKKRIQPEQVIINCSKDSVIAKPPEGHRWKAVTHDDSVTWLVSWTENIQGSNKYIMLNPSSRLKGEKDWMKYETARKLKKCVDRIRDDYKMDWKSKEMRIRQRAVALYFIDKLALRAGNEKEEGETADTVGCCSLRVEHIKLHEEDDGQEFVVEFDFLGKDSIRYQNKVAVEKRVFKNLQLFVENKQGDDDLFDRLNTSILNKYLQDLMPGLTAKVFRTFNASITLQNQLKALTVPEDGIPSKILSYNRANRAVAVLCNHQRAAPKTFDKQMANLKEKVKAKMTAIKEAKKDLKSVKQEYKKSGNDKMKTLVERKKKAVERLEEQLSKLEMQATDKEENKEIALGTSKLNYLDPRISVAWCKKWEVPMEKVYNRTQRDKFRWAIDMADENYVF